MKKTICILCALTVLAALCGTASCEQTGPDLYHIGLEVTGLMGEIAGNEAYLSAFGRPETWTEVREAADTGDYDQPTAVYSVRLEDAEGYVREMFAADDETRELWENLPEELTQQLLYRVTPATFCNMANARAGTASISFASAATAVIRNSELTGDETASYLYTFDKGIPILVSFGYHGASGMFVFIPKEAQNLEGIRAALPGLTVEPLETGE